ncbi:hypothetical protein BT96DRAFT_933124 [Gymnopus androsaceus JB14]|uniref:Uncharacterized protein n=1 Tax=Gymnopus androsaceus JB14 TaxID=1447944 RepID=A0A6A4IFZ7_9AGAR|nr:hypothetical protein BT96DRAFT_933124 [Gymnopus androsaceus JB14]
MSDFCYGWLVRTEQTLLYNSHSGKNSLIWTKSLSEFENNNSLIRKLIVYAINRCVLTSVVAIIEVILVIHGVSWEIVEEEELLRLRATRSKLACETLPTETTVIS